MSKASYGLTAENMMRSFPIALANDPDMIAIAKSVADVLEQHDTDIHLLKIYQRIDELPEDLLDILAKDFKVDWYDYDDDLDTKRQVFKDSFYMHRHLGTQGAALRAIQSVDPDGNITDWYDYGGSPYHFAISLKSDTITAEKRTKMLRKLRMVKRLTAWLDDIETEIESPTSTIYTGACNAMSCTETRLPELNLGKPFNSALYVGAGMGLSVCVTEIPERDFVFYSGIVSKGEASAIMVVRPALERLVLDVVGLGSGILRVEGSSGSGAYHALGALDLAQLRTGKITNDGLYEVSLFGVTFIRLVAETAPSTKLTVKSMSVPRGSKETSDE